MNDKKVITLGLVIFLILVTYPFWRALLAGVNVSRPAVEKPVGETKCIEEKAFMTANHMQVLNTWRDAVVRNDIAEYTSTAYGKKYEMSLTKTCLKCHNKREEFCNRCHNYLSITPTCWNCHNEQKGIIDG
jgi:hypothetical protein